MAIKTSSVSVSTNTKANIMKEINSIIITKAEFKITREFIGKVKNPKKNSKGMVKRHKVTRVETGRQVVDTQATVAARKAALKALVNDKKFVIDHAAVKNSVAVKRSAQRSIAQRMVEREQARLFQIEQAGLVGQLAHIEGQLATLRAAKLNASFTKARRKDAPKAHIKGAKVRTGRKPARLSVPACPKVCFIGKLSPVVIPVRDVNVTREEARALLAVANAAPVARKAAHSTMSAIAMFTHVDSLVERAILAIVTGEAFVLAAQARMNDIINSLPAVAQVMTMSLNNTEDISTIKFFSKLENSYKQFSNFFGGFTIDSISYTCPEAYFQSKKFEQFDPKYAATICGMSGSSAKKAGGSRAHKINSNWDNERIEVMREALKAKFSQNENLKELLLSTGEATLIEANPYDSFWGGIKPNSANMLGRLLMELREEFTRGDGNLSKNVTVEEANPSSVSPKTTTKDSQAMNYINASAFANAAAFDHNDGAPAQYSEVAPLVNFGNAEEIINFDGNGKSFAEMLASIMYPMQEAMFFDSDTEEVRAQIQASVDHKNARAAEAQEKFLAAFGAKLGFIKHVTLEYGVGGSYARASYNLKSHFESLFTMAQIPQYENAETVYSGLKLDEFAPRIKVEDANVLWLAILAKATYNLTVEERAQLLGLLFHNVARVDGTVISRDKISIDVANAIVTTGNGRVLRANKASNFGKAGGFIVLDGLHSIFLFALQALGGTAKQLETSINLAVKLFQPEHNYGHKPDVDDMAHFVRTNFVYTNAVKATNSDFPSIEMIGGKQSPDFLGWILSRGVIATCDKTNIKFVTINAGAEAVGVGYSRDEFGNLDQMFTANDTNKPTKLFNRPAANNYDCADLPNRVASNFGFALSNGKVARTKGVMMNVAYTNSLLTLGSGVAMINPATKFEFSIAKKEKQPTNLSMFGYSATNNANFKKQFVAGVEKRIAELKGETFAAGEVMLFVELGGKRYDLVSNTEKAAEVTVKGGYVRNNVLDENSVEIVLEVDLLGNTGFVKTRRFATKFTTKPFEAKFSVEGEWDIILNNECTKGHGALLEMFANATGNRYLNNSTCQFTTPDDDSFDVRSTDNAFYTWRDANIQKDVTLTISIAKSVWENIKRFCSDTVRVITETTENGYPCVVVEETVDVIFGQLVFDVEISSPLESVSTSNFTLESASAVYLQSQRLGNILFEECLTKADKFVALASNFAGVDRDGMTVVDLDDEASFNSFLANVPSDSTQRQLVAGLAVKYPAGIQFFLGNLEFAVNLGLVATFGQFNGLNGSAARETAEIVNFLLDVIYNGASDKELMINAKRAFAKIVRTGIDSKKVLKKPTRSGRLIYGKVRTSFDPILHSEDGIPTVVMNIDCPMVRMLGIPTDGSIVNYYVGFARTPMPFLGGARVRLTDDANICDVAHVLVDPYVWHQLNEGDSDGDGIAVMNLSALDFTKVEIIKLNNSVMGIAGYEHLYGDNVPFADFMSEKDKAGKKSFRGVINLMSTQVKDPDTDTNVDIVREFVTDFAARVANHYKSAVGASYGICSKLVFQAADLAAAGPSKELDNVLTACLIAWRSMYEGLGLSGYSANAARVFHIILLASNDVRSGKVHVHPITGEVGNAYGKPEAELQAGAELLKAEFGDFQDVNLEVFHALITSRCVTRMAVKIEGFGNLSKYWLDTPGLEEAGIKFGALRRISQGDDRVAEEVGLMEEAQLEATGEYVGKPASRLFNDTVIVEETFTNLLLGEVAAKVCEFHALLVETKQSAIDAEVAGH